MYYDNGKFIVKDLGYKELSREDEENGNITVGDEEVKFYEGTDMSRLEVLK